MDENLKGKQSSESDEIDLIEVFRKVWDGRKTIFKWMGIFFVIGIIIVIASPKEYKSEVTLLVETGSGSNGMSGLLQQFGGLTGLSGLGSGQGEDALTPELYPDIIKSTPFLLEVMNEKVTDSKYDSTLSVQDYIARYTRPGVGQVVMGYTLGLPGKIIGWIKGKPKILETSIPKQKGPLKLTPLQNGISGELANRIRAKQGESNSTLIISVEMQDPKVAALLVDSVVKSLTTYIIDYRTQKAKTDLKFVEDRHAEAEERYVRAQRTLAGYKDRNKNIILALAQTSEQNLQAEYNLAFNIYNTLSQQLEQAKMKVQERTPVFKVVEPAKVALIYSNPKPLIINLVMIFIGGMIGLSVCLGTLFFKKAV